ncbi:MAG: SDR family NAD(P)-dependent oxidoreductase, partial [Lachnospiraceae bacterium]|nr:SDR family NAD(P)-dependent oxidoreductase [Lachnospiraceae bacterium]
MKNLKNKVVFITGGARGLGYAMAEKFAAEGSKIVIGDIREVSGNLQAFYLIKNKYVNPV